MRSQAALRGLLPYPEKELKEAQEALLFSEFHDILPGSSIQAVEEASLQMLDHGLEILNYWKRRAFFALLSGEKDVYKRQEQHSAQGKRHALQLR